MRNPPRMPKISFFMSTVLLALSCAGMTSGCGGEDYSSLTGPGVGTSDAGTDSQSGSDSASADSSTDVASGSDSASADSQVDPCATDTICEGENRQCTSQSGTASCGDCLAGFHEDAGVCVKDTTCGANTCGGGDHGSCDDSSGSPVCSCKKNYAGEHCETCADGYLHSRGDPNVCILSPCANAPCDPIENAKDGSCHPKGDTKFSCDCETGYVWDGVKGTCEGCFDLDGDKVSAGPSCSGPVDCNDNDADFSFPGQVIVKDATVAVGTNKGPNIKLRLPYWSTSPNEVVLSAKYNAVAPKKPDTKVLVPLSIEAPFYGAQAGSCFQQSPPACSASNATWTPEKISVGPLPRFPGDYQLFIHTYAGENSTTCAEADRRLENYGVQGIAQRQVGTLSIEPASECKNNHFEIRAMSWSSHGTSHPGGDIRVKPGETFTLEMSYRITGVNSQSGNIHQLVVGDDSESIACLQLGQLPKCYNGSDYVTRRWSIELEVDQSTHPGTYQLRAKHTQQYTCKFSDNHPNAPGALGAYDNSPPRREYTFAVVTVAP